MIGSGKASKKTSKASATEWLEPGRFPNPLVNGKVVSKTS